ncbi:MAG TPA: hypothetical protein PKC87_05670 [Candidatus Absconditabacterales bacterium]|nr:hypothetical protein [Candidatus Absconditabacterales bacterium]
MRSKINEDHNRANQYEEKNRILPIIRAYLTAVLLMNPSAEYTTQANIASSQQEVTSLEYQEDKVSPGDPESVESVISYEIIFKHGIRETLKHLNAIQQIPMGGKHIDYYRDEGNLKGKKLSQESIQSLRLPEKFDISPRNINRPVESMVLYLGNRKFSITPDLGKIKNIYLTPEELVIETTLFIDITYDKQIKLPNLLLKLWRTPIGKGQKAGFVGTTVTEL